MKLLNVTKSLTRTLMLLACVAIGANTMAQSHDHYVITNGSAYKRAYANVGDKYLALDLTSGTAKIVVKTTFDESCVWTRTGTVGYYYQEDAAGNRYLLNRTGSTLNILTIPVGTYLESGTQWYDWTWGVACQELDGDARYYWVTLNEDGSQWILSPNTYGRPGDLTQAEGYTRADGNYAHYPTSLGEYTAVYAEELDANGCKVVTGYHSNTAADAKTYSNGTPIVAATYTPVIVELIEGTTAGGMTALTLDKNSLMASGTDGITATLTTSAFTSTAYTQYTLRKVEPTGDPSFACAYMTPYFTNRTVDHATKYAYNGTITDAVPADDRTPVTVSGVTYTYTLSSNLRPYLTVEQTATGATISRTSTTWAAPVSGTLTVVATYANGETQTLTQDITLAVAPTAIAATEAEFDLTVGESYTGSFTLEPAGATASVTASGITGATVNNNDNTYIIEGTTVGEQTLTLTAADGITATVTVRVHPAAPTAITFGTEQLTGITGPTGATFYYTTDPTVDLLTSGGTAWDDTVVSVSAGQTVYAVSEQSGLRSLTVFSQRYSGPESGVATTADDNGNIAVTLNDLEDHSWSYYSDPECPIRSLNPADVKITYYGNGQTENNMTTTDNADAPISYGAKATGVRVGIANGETQNTFVYYKTLERADGASATSVAGATGRCAYTTIPNPFQVRPTGESTTVNVATVYISGTLYGDNCRIQVAYTDANGSSQTWTSTNSGSVNTTIMVQAGTSITLSARGYSGIFFSNKSSITARYNNASGTQIGTVQAGNSGANNSQSYTINSSTTITVPGYRGFYAWRVKSISSGSKIYTASGEEISAGDNINAETEVYFAPTSEYGMEVELEALWAQAYVQTGSSNLTTRVANNITSAHERNFHVVNSNGNASSYAKSYPCTVIGRTPNSTTLNSSRTLSGAFTATANTKFEDVVLNASDNIYTAAGHDLVFGRGITGTVKYVRGIGSSTNNPQYMIRLETGIFNYVSFLRGYHAPGNTQGTDGGSTISGTMSVRAILGNDYDRANVANNYTLNNKIIKGVTDNLTINYTVFLGDSNTINNNEDNETLKVWIKSGKIGKNISLGTASANATMYLGVSSTSAKGHRKLFVEGGQLASVAGGIDNDNQGESNNHVKSLSVYMKGGHVRGALYGGGARSIASGDRNYVLLDGIVTGWIGAGCNGESGTGTTYYGQTHGTSSVYVGGEFVCGGAGSSTDINGSQGGIVFGAGKGVQGNTRSGQMTYGTTVVIADACDIERDVYGGGNYGYALDNTSVYVLGGTVHGSVYGGSNQNNGPVITAKMKGGDIKGSLYGGSNTTGTISESVTMDITGGTVEGSVYGGGKGNPTRVTKNVSVTVAGDAKVLNDVYGGSEEGVVNSTMATPASNTPNQTNNSYTTKVNVEGNAVVKGNVYGGGFGTSSSYAHVAGDVTVTVNENATVEGSVFGCNNANGRPLGKVNVNIFGGTIGNVYGGGNLAAYGRMNNNAVEAPHVLMTGGHVLQNVFGGGLGGTAIVNQNTDVKVQGGTVDGNVYGGGSQAAVTGKTEVVIGK